MTDHRELAQRVVGSGFLTPEFLLASPWVIGERYEVLGLIGQGGAGAVFHARDTRLGREVALKLLDVGSRHSERFLQEIRLLAGLGHPGLIVIHDSGLHDGAPYYVMEIARGGTLAEAPLDREAWLRVLVQVARTCGAIHAAGIVHRDLKPENVLLIGGEPRLADFGVAKQLRGEEPDGPEGVAGPAAVPPLAGLARQTRAGTLVGTPHYMAPEQIGDGVVSPATDVHALGVMLFERLCGVPPFPDDDGIQALCIAVLDDARPSPLDHESGLPRGLARIAERAIARRPEDRYADGDQLADALAAWLDGVVWWRDARLQIAVGVIVCLLLGWGLARLSPSQPAVAESPRPIEPTRALESPRATETPRATPTPRATETPRATQTPGPAPTPSRTLAPTTYPPGCVLPQLDLKTAVGLSDILSNALMIELGCDEPEVQAFLSEQKNLQPKRSAEQLLQAASKHFKLHRKEVDDAVQKFLHCNCRH